MKYFIDGDQLVVVLDDFVNLQESPAIFYPLSSETAITILKVRSLLALPLDVLTQVANLLCTPPTGQKERTMDQVTKDILKNAAENDTNIPPYELC